MSILDQITDLPATKNIVDQVLGFWPQHRSYIEKSFSQRPKSTDRLIEQCSQMVIDLANGDLSRQVAGYKWFCEMVIEEEYHFRRHGKYRHDSFETVNANVYQNSQMMDKYMDGVLISQVLWSNHAAMFAYYRAHFLVSNPDQYSHLEIGPGHGALLYYAMTDNRCREAAGWDVSPTSVQHTRECLERVSVKQDVQLSVQDILGELPEFQWDSVVISEVLEHLERPDKALQNLRKIISPRGRIYINFPVNSPTIDHIYLLKEPEEVVEMVRNAGFKIGDIFLAPCAGYSEEQARRREVTISCGVVATVA